MTFDYSFDFQSMMNDAQTQFKKAGEQISAIEGTLTRRLDGTSRRGLAGAMAASAAWGAAYLCAYWYLQDDLSWEPMMSFLSLLGVGASLALVAALIVGNLVQMRYYEVIFNAEKQLHDLKARVDAGSRNLSSNMDAFMVCEKRRWEMPLTAGASIFEETTQIGTRLSELETLSSGPLNKLKEILYYIVCILWTVIGSHRLFDVALSLLEEDTNRGDLEMMLWVSVLIACLIEFTVSKKIWVRYGCSVNNMTLFASILGPVIFGLLTVLVVLVFFIVGFAIAIAVVALCVALLLSLFGGR